MSIKKILNNTTINKTSPPSQSVVTFYEWLWRWSTMIRSTKWWRGCIPTALEFPLWFSLLNWVPHLLEVIGFSSSLSLSNNACQWISSVLSSPPLPTHDPGIDRVLVHRRKRERARPGGGGGGGWYINVFQESQSERAVWWC